ncbi:MAG: phosphoglycerate kinase [Candidatus Entotheonella factor]|uniref:Phosphoglycerate kinase n=1 Tax=Entotheonella factor TaxID=1429438 RepID=W4LDV9_ENTF1|nr:phosphoglycerate kinase [Candidatus Entotheonella palauensis]ETW96129.1 MAG: phosphoglycerate kinase [Candidatus Entotheonella factor]
MPKAMLRDLAIQGKRLFIRVDFNVPLTDDRKVANDTRIQAALPTIQYAQAQGASIILASHLGRPKGQINPKLSLQPVATHLESLLGAPVQFVPDCVGSDVEAQAKALPAGAVMMLENLRFHPEEEQNDASFSEGLSNLADIYVNDAFGTAHRAHASTAGITQYVQPAVAGFLMDKELTYLSQVTESPDQPVVAILGGAKVSDKIPLIDNLLDNVSTLVLGGAMAYTLLQAQGYHTGNSLVEPDYLDLAKTLLDKAADRQVDFLLPSDHIIAQEPKADATTRIVADEGIPADSMGLDIGPQTVARFRQAIAPAKTVVWNGPMGMFELEPFRQGTLDIAQAVAACEGTTVIGGGDTIAALALTDCQDAINHISTGGGATLEFLEGKILPGVDCLTERGA